MNSPDSRPAPRPSAKVQWGGVGIVALLVLGTAMLDRAVPVTWAAAYGIAAVNALGIVTMAWLMRRSSAYPGWAWWTTAGLMTIALLASVLLASDPGVWERQMRPNAWMLPWFLLVMGTAYSRRGICSPAHPRSGWIMVGTGAVFSAIVLGAHAVADAVGRLFAA